MSLIDLSGVPDAGDFPPPGEHLAQLVDLKKGESQNKNLKWDMTFNVIEGPHTGSQILDSITWTKEALKRVKLVLKRLGVNTDVQFDPDHLLPTADPNVAAQRAVCPGSCCRLTAPVKSDDPQPTNFAGRDLRGARAYVTVEEEEWTDDSTTPPRKGVRNKVPFAGYRHASKGPTPKAGPVNPNGPIPPAAQTQTAPATAQTQFPVNAAPTQQVPFNAPPAPPAQQAQPTQQAPAAQYVPPHTGSPGIAFPQNPAAGYVTAQPAAPLAAAQHQAPPSPPNVAPGATPAPPFMNPPAPDTTYMF